MRDCAALVFFIAALSIGVHAQPAGRLEFEAASINPVPPFDGSRPLIMGCRGGPGTNDPVLFTCENFSLSNMVSAAYALGTNELSAPDWMNTTLFDIRARLEKGSTYEQFMLMFQHLLADRFKLVVHREAQERTGYQLLLSKDGPKFKASAPVAENAAPDSDASTQPPSLDRNGYPVFARGHSGTRFAGNRARMSEPNMTMDQLAVRMSGMLHEPVSNATGLSGSYEISFYWTVDPLAAPEGDGGPSLLQALQQQLGLRVVRTQKVPVNVLIVDHAERQPSPN